MHVIFAKRHLQHRFSPYKNKPLATMEPRFNEPLYNEFLGITKDIFQPSNSVMYGKEPRYNELSIQRTNFPQSLGTSLNPGSTVLKLL